MFLYRNFEVWKSDLLVIGGARVVEHAFHLPDDTASKKIYSHWMV